MAAFRLGSDYLKNNFTLVDNEFLLGYLPSADPDYVKIYLFGLARAGGTDGAMSLFDVALRLQITPEKVLDGFRFWQEAGLVSLTETDPLQLTYHAVKPPLPKKSTANLKKYRDFQSDMVALFPEKFLVPNDVVPFMELLDEHKMEPDAMIQLVQYCIRKKGETVSTPYLLAVANNWVKDGLLSQAAVCEHIERLEAATEELREVLAALAVKSAPGIEERDLYRSWRNRGFSHEAVLAAAKLCKRTGGINKLNRLLTELGLANAFSPLEIDVYRKEKDFNRELTSQIVKNIGAYYASLDTVTETYLLPWLEKGFSADSLLLLSKLAFRRSVKTLEGLNEMAQRFHKLGIVSETGIETYIERAASADERIKELLAVAGAPRYVTNRDREMYRVWVEDWKLGDDMINAAAKMSKGFPYPITNINRLLLSAKETGVLQSARPILDATPGAPRHEYSQEALAAVFSDADDPDNVEV